MKNKRSSSGSESNRKVHHPVNKGRMQEEERTRSRSSQSGRERLHQSESMRRDNRQEEEWDDEALSMENSFGTGREFGMAVDNKKRHEGESKSVHVEDWENDPYSYQNDEDDVRGEFAVRRNRGKDNEVWNEKKEWKLQRSGTKPTEHSGGNGNRESRGTRNNKRSLRKT